MQSQPPFALTQQHQKIQQQQIQYNEQIKQKTGLQPKNFHLFPLSMGSPVIIILFPFISVRFRQPARQNPASHGQTWDFPSSPWNSTEKGGGVTFGGATL